MSDVRIEVRADRLLRSLDKLAPTVTANLRTFVQAFTVRLFGQVRVNIVELFRSTGPLYQSVDYAVTDTGKSIRGRVFTRGVPYARIQEEGGQTGPHVILPRNVSVLAFEGPAGLVFAKRVNHPGSNIPARPYMSSALAELRGEYEGGIREVVNKALGEMRG